MMNATKTRIELMADTVARPAPLGGWWLMNRQSGGLASSARFCTSLEDLVERYAVRIGERDRDEHGSFVRVIRAGHWVR